MSALLQYLISEKQKEKDTLVDCASVTVLSQVEHKDTDFASSSHNTSADLSSPQPFFCKELLEVDENGPSEWPDWKRWLP